MEKTKLRLENQLCHRLYVASNGLTRLYRPLLKKLNITYPQYIVLMALWEEDAVHMGKISEKTFMDKGFLTSLTTKMQSQGLLEIKADESDKRKKIICLTPKGIQLEEEAQIVPESLSCTFAKKSKADINVVELQNLLDKLNKLIHE